MFVFKGLYNKKIPLTVAAFFLKPAAPLGSGKSVLTKQVFAALAQQQVKACDLAVGGNVFFFCVCFGVFCVCFFVCVCCFFCLCLLVSFGILIGVCWFLVTS